MHAYAAERSQEVEFLRLYYKAIKQGWKLEELVGRDGTFDFTRPFMPDPVTPPAAQEAIDPFVRLKLSQIRGSEYFSIIVFIEDVIIDFLWTYVGQQRYRLPIETQQALTNFISEEMKHTLLFQAFRRRFEQGFGFPCRTMERTEGFVQFVLKFDPLGVLLFILHGEVMTYINYSSSVDKSRERLDPYFSDLLKFHWIEEAGHVTLDELLLEQLAAPYDEAARLRALEDYFSLVDFLHGALRRLGARELEDLRAIAGAYEPVMDMHDALRQQQRCFYVQSYLLDVMQSDRFRSAVETLTPRARPLLDERVARLQSTLV
jgi:hypothetical protein